MIYKVLITNEGLPTAGLTPTWNCLYDLDGNDKSGDAPTINEIGGGWYKFEVIYGTSPFDVAELVGIIDADSSYSNYERYIGVIITVRDTALLIFCNNSRYTRGSNTNSLAVYGDDGTTTEISIQETHSSDDTITTRELQ